MPVLVYLAKLNIILDSFFSGRSTLPDWPVAVSGYPGGAGFP